MGFEPLAALLFSGSLTFSTMLPNLETSLLPPPVLRYLSQCFMPIVVVTLFSTSLCLYKIIWYRTRSYPPFPGPPGLPLLGNVLQIGDKQWLQYYEWHKTYGPIFSLNFAGQHVLVVGSARIAADLMDRRSHIYSDRPRFIMATEILTGGMNLAFARWGDRWKRMRKAANIGLSSRASAAYTALQEQEARHFLRGLLACGGKIDPHIRRTSASMVLSAVYAYPPLPLPSTRSASVDTAHSNSDTVVKDVEDYVSRMLKAALPGNYLVEFFPWMMAIPEWFPGAGWKRQGHEWFKKDTAMFMNLVTETHTALEKGTRSKCFVSELANSVDYNDLSSVETAWLAGMMFGAGAESLAATFSFFVLAMILYPKVQTKLRDELNDVVGNPEDGTDSPRFPTFHDTQRMPYLQAVVKEVMRWRPIGPMGVPHRSVEDDVYEGHFIPAGTLIFPNVWAMHRDLNIYTDVEDFKPERFLAEDGVTLQMYPDTKDLGHHGFGFGKRACIGYHVANNVLAINAAHLIWAFTIGKCIDSNGVEISPDPDAFLDEGLAVRPMPFECELRPRSAMVVEMLKGDLSS